VLIDYTPLKNREMKVIDFAAHFDYQQIRDAANAQIDWMLNLISDLTDADLTFDPIDPDADDPHAVEGEEKIGWSIAHMIVHVTASTEEWATYSSILARGIPYPAEPRVRYETPWRDITTKAQAVERLEESRRMRLGYLDAWPNVPNLDIKRTLSPRFIEAFGEFNASACMLFGMSHEAGHFDQMAEAKRQALAARGVTA
jgi:hypothetical protein